MRRVEREAARLELVDRDAVVRAAVALAEPPLVEGRRLAIARGGRDDDDALAQPKRGLDRVGEPRSVGIGHGLARGRVDRPAGLVARPVLGRVGPADDEPVDDDLDRVALVAVERRGVGEVVLLAVDAHPDEALLAGALEDAVALGLAVLDQRAQHEQPRALRAAPGPGRPSAGWPGARSRGRIGAVRMADAGEQQPQVVVDLGDRADGRPRVPRRALLVDRDRRRQPVDLVDVGLLHLAEELAGVGAQALDVAPLALGVDGVEGQADLPLPDRPVITTSRSRGNATSTFLRLCSRAPRTTIRSWGTRPVYRMCAKWNRCSGTMPAPLGPGATAVSSRRTR